MKIVRRANVNPIVSDKEPWLAASLSWLLPGTGHLYRRAYAPGLLFFTLGGLLYVSWVASFASSQVGLGVPHNDSRRRIDSRVHRP